MLFKDRMGLINKNILIKYFPLEVNKSETNTILALGIDSIVSKTETLIETTKRKTVMESIRVMFVRRCYSSLR